MIDQRGDGLTDVIIGAIITAFFAVAGITFAFSHPGDFRASQADINDLVTTARDQARSGAGSTLYIVNGATSWTGTVYLGRPENGASVGVPVKVRTHPGSAQVSGNAQYGIFFSSAGMASIQSWDGSSQLASEPACTNGFQVVITVESKTATDSFPCQ